MQELASQSRRINSSRQFQLQNISTHLQSLKASLRLKLGEEDPELIAAHVSRAAFTVSRVATEHKILKSLYFEKIKDRHSKIPLAHQQTFEWIFKSTAKTSSQASSDINFVHWLESQNGFYWISGKAGSGKSTLMKYVSNHRHTEKALQRWVEDAKLVVARFFFWNAGTEMQKSLEGLLQSLLYEILRQESELIHTVCPDRWDSAGDNCGDNSAWDITELSQTMDRLVNQTTLSAKFCFFIDGLDEYERDHGEVIKVLDALMKSPRIKICLSSRPWNIFEDAYGHSPKWRLRLQDLTKKDIEHYVRGKFEEHERLAEVYTEDTESDHLIHAVVDKSQGVFLWVYLVVRSLCEGLTNGDSIKTLEARLQLLPAELDEFFRHILDQIDKVYKPLTARTFLETLQATEPLTLIAHSFLDEIDPEFVFQTKTSTFGQRQKVEMHEMDARCSRMRRRLDGRCKGLLEVSVNHEEPSYWGHRVEFLHRTVRDFLTSKGVYSELSSQFEPTLNLNENLCKAYLAQIITMPGEMADLMPNGIIGRQLHNLMYHARLCELETGRSNTRLLSEVEHVIHRLLEIYRTSVFPEGVHHLHQRVIFPEICYQQVIQSSDKHNPSFFKTVVTHGLELCVAERLEAEPFLINASTLPVLALALPSASADPEAELSTSMIQILLGSGADPNQDYNGWIPWANWICSIGKDPSLRKVSEAQLRTLELLLHYEADPNRRHRDRTVWEEFLLSIESSLSGMLSIAQRTFCFQLVDILLLHGANSRVKVRSERSPDAEITLENIFRRFPPSLQSQLLRRLEEQRRRALFRSCSCNLFAWIKCLKTEDESRRPLLHDHT